MNWYRMPYFGQTAEKRKYKIMQKLDAGENPLLVYLIMLAPTPVNQMEIVSPAEYRRQQRRNGTEPLILGAAIGMDEAKALAGEIVADVYRLTGTADVKGYYDDARVKRSKSCLSRPKISNPIAKNLKDHDLPA